MDDFYYNHIMDALRNGGDPEKLANEFAASINQAMEDKRKEDEKTKSKNTQIQDTKLLVETVIAYFNQYYPDMLKDVDLSDTTYEDYIELFDTVASMKPLFDWSIKCGNGPKNHFQFNINKVKSKAEDTTTMETKHSDPIQKFLRDNNLLF